MQGEGSQLVLDQGAALEHGQQPGRVLQDADVGQRIAVDDEQVGQVPSLTDPSSWARPMSSAPLRVAQRITSSAGIPASWT